MDDAVRVVVRVRPFLARERESGRAAIVDNEKATIIVLSDPLEEAPTTTPRQIFSFDAVYGEDCAQSLVYESAGRPLVQSCLTGYNATIFAYGQTGTGKTYSMDGPSLADRGIIPRAVEEIFDYVEAKAAEAQFLVRASCFQIYQEIVSDLLVQESKERLQIREDPVRGVYADGLSETVVTRPDEVYDLMRLAGSRRATSATRLNDLSSRSHAVFAIVVEQSYEEDSSRQHAGGKAFRVGKLNLVDLAGSERVRISGASGQRLEESKKINASLSALGNVISALAEKRKHIPYRDSKLTRLLEDSLGGNCKTTMLATISPSADAINETISTLKFATRAKKVTNAPRVNEDLDQKSLLRKYERELRKLRSELEERSRHVVDSRRLLELDERRRQAEQDRLAAIQALEARSLEFMREKEEKQLLEERIASLTSQIFHKPQHNSSTLLLNSVSMHDHDYEAKLAEVERERDSLSEEKAQVERYKQLLLKQRDIMIALTERLNERDDQISSLQEEIENMHDTSDLENRLDEKTAQCIHLQRLQLELEADARLKQSSLDDLDKTLDLRDKERRAVHTIFEKKIAVLLESVHNSIDKDPDTAKHHLASLRRLVAASVDALKQADTEAQAARHRHHHMRRLGSANSILQQPPPPPPPENQAHVHASNGRTTEAPNADINKAASVKNNQEPPRPPSYATRPTAASSSVVQ